MITFELAQKETKIIQPMEKKINQKICLDWC